MGIYFTVKPLILTIKIDLNICRMVILDKCAKKKGVKLAHCLTTKARQKHCIVQHTKRKEW